MSPVKLPLESEAAYKTADTELPTASGSRANVGQTESDVSESTLTSMQKLSVAVGSTDTASNEPSRLQSNLVPSRERTPRLEFKTGDDPPNLGLTFESIVTYVRAFVLRNAVPAARYIAFGLVGWFAAMALLIVIFAFFHPPGSALMAIRWAQGHEIQHEWVDIDRISPNLVRAVVASEDGRFCKHWGVDPREVLEAIKRARNGRPRGASTITMQLAKNLFLWPSQSYFRKVLEVPLTFAIELFWSKRRIMEVYLNVVEWGPGIFGAKAAARAHFRTSAKSLSASQSALLAVSLPAPMRRKARRPSRGMKRMAGVVLGRMKRNRATTRCVLPAGG